MTKNKLAPIFQLIVQGVITVLYAAMAVHITFSMFAEKGLDAFSDLSFFLALFVILIASLAPPVTLRIRRKLHSEDGEIFPLLFLVIATEASLIVPLYMQITGLYVIPPDGLMIFERFSIQATAAMFLLSSLEYYGFQNAKLGLYTFYILLACLIVAMLAPYNTNRDIIEIYNSYSDAFIIFAILLIYLVTAFTFILSAIHEKTASNIRRCIAFLLLILGMILTLVNNKFTAIAAAISYLTGVIILCYNTRDSF